MNPPSFERLNRASVALQQAQDAPMNIFARKVEGVVTAVEDVLNPITRQREDHPPRRTLIGRAIRAIGRVFQSNSESISISDLDERISASVSSIISRNSAAIVDRLIRYVQAGEGSRVELDSEKKELVLEYLTETIQGAPVDDFTIRLNDLIETLERINAENNTLDWTKMQSILFALYKIYKHP